VVLDVASTPGSSSSTPSGSSAGAGGSKMVGSSATQRLYLPSAPPARAKGAGTKPLGMSRLEGMAAPTRAPNAGAAAEARPVGMRGPPEEVGIGGLGITFAIVEQSGHTARVLCTLRHLQHSVQVLDDRTTARSSSSLAGLATAA
jgi:hypothetical protein